jgi:gliding-associated putative ABC transporter substrate-binding component GldG
MNTRPLKAQTLLRVVIILAILILVNIISIRVFGRLDVTDKKLFTLSSASKELMRSLDDKVTVKAYFTEDIPAPYNNNRRALLDELNEYKAYSRGNLQYEFIDPSGEKGEQDAQQQGIAPVQVQVVKEDKLEVKRAYMGLLFLYEDKKEVIPVVQNTSTLEYDISSTIKRLTSRTQKRIGFLTGQGEPALSELSRVQQLLGKQYQVTTVDVGNGKPVPPDVAALVVMAPAKPFSEPDKYHIDQYLMRGGKVAFLLNRVDANLQNRFGRALELNLDDLLDAYGLRVNPDLVRDAQCANISIVQSQFGFQMQSQVPFPYLPLASNFSKDNTMVKDLKGIVLFFVSSVDTSKLAAKNLQGEILIRSSNQSGRQATVFMFDPLQRYTKEEFSEKEIPLAALVHGRFKSAFEGKPFPVDTAAGAPNDSSNRLSTSPDSRVVLVGDGDFARDQYLGNRDNLTFFANMIDYLVDDAGLITIRSKDVTLPPLDQVSDGTKKLVKYANLVVPPALVLAYGLVRWRMRKARKKALELH